MNEWVQKREIKSAKIWNWKCKDVKLKVIDVWAHWEQIIM